MFYRTQNISFHYITRKLIACTYYQIVIKSRRMRWVGRIARMGVERGAYRILVGRPEERRPLGRPRRRWEDNIKMDLEEMGWGHGLD
jgi:hypothetical protein